VRIFMPMDQRQLSQATGKSQRVRPRSEPLGAGQSSSVTTPVDFDHRRNLVDLFREFANCTAEFLQYDNGYRSWKYTYAQVGRAACRFAKRLAEHNIHKGEKVIFWSENRPEWVVAFWGCVLAGVIVVPIDYRTSSRFLRRVQRIVEARLILAGDEVQVPSWDGKPPVLRLSEIEWTEKNQELPAVPTGRDDVVEIVFTSGATGEPKGVVIRHRNILANIVSPEQIIAKYAKWFRPVFPLRFLVLIPLSHMFGQVLTLFILPLIPGAAIFMRGYSPHEILRQIHSRRASVVVTVPKILEVLRAQIVSQFPDEVTSESTVPPHWVLRWLKYRRVHSLFGWKFWAFVVGAAPLAKELEQFWSMLGFAVIQGYGLTETAPIVTFNNPFDTREGSVGKPVSGMEVKIAPDGEILVRGESVTSGYYEAPAETASMFEEGWFHTGDIGSFDIDGNLIIQGRKKEVIVTPEGLKVFPEDVEAVLNRLPGLRESAVVGRDQVRAVVVLENGADPNEVIRRANLQLEDQQKIRAVSVWPGDRLPRTESTHKVKRGEIQAWVDSGSTRPVSPGSSVVDVLRKYAPDRVITGNTTLDELGLSSLDRVQLMIDLEQQLDTSIDESLLTGGSTVSALAEIGTVPSISTFPAWNRAWWAKAIRDVTLSAVWLPLTRLVAHARISGLEHLASLRGPVIFAPNHQSHLDTPLILSALPMRYRYRIAVAMWKEYFDAHFCPGRHTRYERFRDRSIYPLVALFFNAFPVPQTEAGARESLRYIGDLVSESWSILFFPEGERTEAGEIKRFLPGIGLLAGHLGVPVIPIRLKGMETILHRHTHWPRPGSVEVTFGAPLHLKGTDYMALAKEVEDAVRGL
jgi:long-chain acyl-CoA synthetase